MIIADASGATVKASDVDRAFSRGNLEKRFGAFQVHTGAEAPAKVKTYKKEPLGPANPLKAEFEKIHAAQNATRAVKRLYRALADKCRRQLAGLRGKAAHERNAAIQESPRQNWLSWLQAEAKPDRPGRRVRKEARMGRLTANEKEIIAYNISEQRKKKYPGHGGGKKCAEEFGVPAQQWSPWESGGRTPDDDRITKIAKFFKVSVGDLRKRPDNWETVRPGWIASKRTSKKKLDLLEAIEAEKKVESHSKPKADGSDLTLAIMKLIS